MLRLLKDSMKGLPFLKQLFVERDQLRDQLKIYKTLLPPGHFYSPIPSIKEIRACEETIFTNASSYLPAIDLNVERQLSLLSAFKEYYADLQFEAHPSGNLRYCYENEYFSYLDAISLYCMIRYVRPKRIIEVGSGYSSCVMLDTNELFFKNAIACTFIEPSPERLKSLIRERDHEHVTILEAKLQDISLDLFASLSAGDILFVDSSHVSKVNSDVNHLVFTILPHLQSGVYIHFHDIFYPFEYPKEWIYAGVAWNEAYLLRAFLQNNNAFEVQFFNSFIKSCFKDRLLEALPLAAKDPSPDLEVKNAPAASLWIRKK